LLVPGVKTAGIENCWYKGQNAWDATSNSQTLALCTHKTAGTKLLGWHRKASTRKWKRAPPGRSVSVLW